MLGRDGEYSTDFNHENGSEENQNYNHEETEESFWQNLDTSLLPQDLFLPTDIFSLGETTSLSDEFNAQISSEEILALLNDEITDVGAPLVSCEVQNSAVDQASSFIPPVEVSNASNINDNELKIAFEIARKEQEKIFQKTKKEKKRKRQKTGENQYHAPHVVTPSTQLSIYEQALAIKQQQERDIEKRNELIQSCIAQTRRSETPVSSLSIFTSPIPEQSQNLTQGNLSVSKQHELLLEKFENTYQISDVKSLEKFYRENLDFFCDYYGKNGLGREGLLPKDKKECRERIERLNKVQNFSQDLLLMVMLEHPIINEFKQLQQTLHQFTKEASNRPTRLDTLQRSNASNNNLTSAQNFQPTDSAHIDAGFIESQKPLSLAEFLTQFGKDSIFSYQLPTPTAQEIQSKNLEEAITCIRNGFLESFKYETPEIENVVVIPISEKTSRALATIEKVMGEQLTWLLERNIFTRPFITVFNTRMTHRIKINTLEYSNWSKNFNANYNAGNNNNNNNNNNACAIRKHR